MLLLNFIAFCDAPENWQLGLQDPATPTVEGMAFFHDYLNSYMIIIGTFVFFLLYILCIRFNKYNNLKVNEFTHDSLLEIIWTILPAFVLLLLAIPSFTLLYSLDDLADPTVTLKVIGHQWYWSYEYSNSIKPFFSSFLTDNLSYDSYMLSTSDLDVNKPFRLLEVDNIVKLPICTHIRVLVTASDVLHSWAIPSFGIKVDACPGRLSQASIYLKRTGIYYGQCSEICGINHGFMPIVVQGVTPGKSFLNHFAITI
jgi:cytochrome c oxidase subunit 2